MNQNHIAKLEIWSAEEFEYVETVLAMATTKQLNMPQMFNLKLTSGYEIMPMPVFLMDLYSNFPHNIYLRKKREEMYEIITSVLKLQE